MYKINRRKCNVIERKLNWSSGSKCKYGFLDDSFQIKRDDRPLFEDLLPLLEKLCEEHPTVEVQDMASDLRITIATHGAVWSHRTNDAAKTLGKPKDTVKRESAAFEGIVSFISILNYT